MTDKDWQYVAEIARCGSITKAAEHLFISQPSLTQALRRIEEYYGAEFFSRARDGVQLTDMGRAYLAAADRIGSLYQRLQEEIGSAAGLSEARLNIGITAVQSSLLRLIAMAVDDVHEQWRWADSIWSQLCACVLADASWQPLFRPKDTKPDSWSESIADFVYRQAMAGMKYRAKRSAR